MSISREEVLEILVHDLPRLLSEQPELRYALVGALAETFARQDDLHAVLEEVRALREDWARDSKALWEDFNARFVEHSRRLEEHSVAIRQLTERLEEHSVAIQQLTERLEEHSVAIQQLTERLEEHSQAIRGLQTSIGGLGARWGLMSEEAFRAGMAGILTEVGLQVERFWQMDNEGYVFGEPDQVEVDVAMHNGRVILVEIKSSVSRGDVTIFQRKVAFYEQVKGVKVARRIIVSPFVESEAAKRARAMGIEVYTSGYEVPM